MSHIVEPLLVVCVATRGRAASLRKLLDTLEYLPAPAGTTVTVVVVENDHQGCMRDAVQRLFRPDRCFVYGLQPRLGIPFARNAALRLALDEGGDYIAFIDDDEWPSSDWLVALWDKACGGRYDLVGGPVEPVLDEPPRSWIASQLWNGLRMQKADSRRKAFSCCQEGAEDAIFIPTSNWMVRGAFLRQHGLAFDESMGFSGGTDLKFYRELKRAGGRVGWCDPAVVQEGLSPGRLTLTYQYRRARDQAVSNFQVRYQVVTAPLVLKGLTYSLGRMLSAFGWLLLIPVSRGAGLFQSVRSLGQAVGRWDALRKRQSEHYRSVV